MPDERFCPVCGRSLEGRRPHAVTCSPGCRRKRLRWIHLACGLGDGRYRTILEYERALVNQAENRARQLEKARAARSVEQARNEAFDEGYESGYSGGAFSD